MRGISTLSTVLLPFFSTPSVFASEQQPFDFGAMSAPQYTLPPLPYAYDVSIAWEHHVTPHTSCSQNIGIGATHLRPDHGAAPQQAPSDIHHQLERSSQNPGRSCIYLRHHFASRYTARHQVQCWRTHQPLTLLAKPRSC